MSASLPAVTERQCASLAFDVKTEPGVARPDRNPHGVDRAIALTVVEEVGDDELDRPSPLVWEQLLIEGSHCLVTIPLAYPRRGGVRLARFYLDGFRLPLPDDPFLSGDHFQSQLDGERSHVGPKADVHVLCEELAQLVAQDFCAGATCAARDFDRRLVTSVLSERQLGRGREQGSEDDGAGNGTDTHGMLSFTQGRV